MVTVRYKKLKSGKFSTYLDVYTSAGENKGRDYEFLKIYVSKDYSDSAVRIAEVDKDKMKIINAIRNKREDSQNFRDNGYKEPGRINYNLLDYFVTALEKNLIVN